MSSTKRFGKLGITLVAVLAVVVIVAAVALAVGEEILEITAYFGRVQVEVEGVPIESETLLYNSRTYMQIRETAEMLGMRVDWDEESNTASIYAAGPETLDNLMEAVTGETGAAAHYLAFADAADEEGLVGIAKIFRAISEAEQKHADDQFALALILSGGEAVKPEAPTGDDLEVGTTEENLAAAIAGETFETTEMYPGYYDSALNEHQRRALGYFTIIGAAEGAHARIYQDLLDNIDEFDEVKYEAIYRCRPCGNIVPTMRPAFCPICGAAGTAFAEYLIAG